MKRAVIFDLDGTLADTLESISHCLGLALADCGFEPPEKQACRLLVGDGARMLVARALRRAGDAEGSAILPRPDADGYVTCPVHLEEVFARYTRYFEKGCMYRVRPYAGIQELLAGLKQAGVKTAVFSNKPHSNAVFVVESLFGKEAFDVILGQQDPLPPKPAPDGVYRILEKLSVTGEETLYTGDSGVDMETGKAAGLMCVGVLWGFRDARELLAHGAQALAEKPQDLLRYL